ncbi:MAG: LysR family transcriptional regulator [Paraburkholderia tropica]|uniref:LysR family transcriptional regulator n=1 Tax=Burkholderia gladioli TaxID=28095 RepID=UPI001E3E0310|nr:LysR family transcriptional regulator [Burkholderia gladioli]
MKRSDLPLLLSLDALLTDLNVTRAAKRMHISQSTLSGHLSRLRDIFGDPLLVPSENGRGMVATERALALRPRLEQALSILREVAVEPAAFDPARSSRTFIVAANDGIFTILGLEVLTEVMRQANPLLRMAVVPATDANLVERMARGEIDIVLGDHEKMPEQLKARYLLTADFALAQRKGHPRGTRAPDLDEYCSLAHVVVSSRADFSTPVDDVLLSLGRTRNVAAAVPNYSQVALILAASDGVATLPRRLLQRYVGQVDLLDLPFAMPPFRLAMGWHPRARQDQAAAWLRGCFPSTEAQAGR